MNDYALKQLHMDNIQVALNIFNIEREILESYGSVDHIPR
jgi:hypothetical protein